MDALDGDNTFGIDQERLVVWGQGSGGYIAFAAASLNEYEEILIPKFIGEDGDGNPVPMVLDFVNGDIYGTSLGINPLDGDTLCYPNHVGYNSDFQACVNMGGAMGDLSWLDEGDIPMISFHSPTDPFAPYDEGIVIVPVLNLPVVEVHGSYAVQQAAAAFGNNDVFANTDFTDPYTMAADAVNEGFDGLFPLNRPEGWEADSAPWEWWDSETNLNSEAGFLTNPDMSAEKGRMFCDSIQWYVAPRLACALDLPMNPCIIPDYIEDMSNLAFMVYPNPADDILHVSSAKLIESVSVHNLLGKLVSMESYSSSNQVEIDLSNYEAGVYIVSVTVDGVTGTERVVVK
jgi:hypothetical protein